MGRFPPCPASGPRAQCALVFIAASLDRFVLTVKRASASHPSSSYAVYDRFVLTVKRASASHPSSSYAVYTPKPLPCASANGATICLVVVMRKIVGEDHNNCQPSYQGCWFVYNDTQDACAQHHRRYEVHPAKPCDTEPHLMASLNILYRCGRTALGI